MQPFAVVAGMAVPGLDARFTKRKRQHQLTASSARPCLSTCSAGTDGVPWGRS